MGRASKLATLATEKDAGSLAGNGPTFSVYKSGNQSISAGTNTKVTMTVEEWDTASGYDTTNSRFTPNVAGYYLISAAISLTSYANRYTAKLYKNGSLYKTLLNNTGNATNDDGLCGSVMVSMNGSTDYIELYVEGTNATTAQGGADQTWMQGCLIAKAA